MSAPLYPTGAIGDEAGFIAVFFIGLLFGFFLERAGFGSSRKLTSVFYFKDWAVLRVMFTAIVVAMLGLLYFSGMGWMDNAAVTQKETYLGAQIVGGLLLGVGFIVGGYCPGTSAVALASGKWDALSYIGGLLFGTLLFGASYDLVQPLYLWGAMGVKSLPEVMGVQAGVVAAGVVLMALLAFTATELFGNRSSAAPRVWDLKLTYQKAGAGALMVLSFGLLVGYGMAAHVQPAQAQVAAPAPATVSKPAGAAIPAGGTASPSPLPAPAAPGGVRKFKKGSSCS
ncbi:MAG: YeeE/YedE family protein [Acidobacteria bacterium]|nr:YeeE/YedE family protein [Acidobacteriota bacterium]